MFVVRYYSELITDDMTTGDVIELERLTCEAQALRFTMRKTGRAAVASRLKQIDAYANDIARRYA